MSCHEHDNVTFMNLKTVTYCTCSNIDNIEF
jgi:hypothetical protein